MQLRALMHSDGHTAELSTTVVEIARIMAHQGVRVVPVSDGGRFVGLVTDWDISCQTVICGKDLERTTVRDVLSKKQARCAETMEPKQAIAMMQRSGARGVAVYDQADSLIGWVHRDDLARQAA